MNLFLAITTFIADNLNVISLIFNIIGTIIIAFSTGQYFKSINNALMAHEISLKTMFNSLVGPSEDIYNIIGTPQLTQKTLRRTTLWMILGIVLLVLGFSIQLILLLKTNTSIN